MKLQRFNFGLVALFLLLTISGLGACNRFEEVGDKYIVTNKRGNDTIFIQEGMQPDTFYALGYKKRGYLQRRKAPNPSDADGRRLFERLRGSRI